MARWKAASAATPSAPLDPPRPSRSRFRGCGPAALRCGVRRPGRRRRSRPRRAARRHSAGRPGRQVLGADAIGQAGRVLGHEGAKALAGLDQAVALEPGDGSRSTLRLTRTAPTTRPRSAGARRAGWSRRRSRAPAPGRSPRARLCGASPRKTALLLRCWSSAWGAPSAVIGRRGRFGGRPCLPWLLGRSLEKTLAQMWLSYNPTSAAGTKKTT